MENINNQSMNTSEGQTVLTKKQRRELRRQEKLNMKQSVHKRTMRNQILFWIPALAIVALLIFGMYKLAVNPIQNVNADLGAIDSATEWVRGNPSAPVTLVEYSDFQCPFCKAQYPNVKQLEKEFPDKLRIIFRQYPLASAHKNATMAALASEAAGVQGKFWEMHDRLFESQDFWKDSGDAKSVFIQYATDFGLNVDQFKKDIDSDEMYAKISEDIASGTKNFVQGTPSFFLNGVKIKTPASYDEFAGVVRARIQEYEANKKNIQADMESNLQQEQGKVSTGTGEEVKE